MILCVFVVVRECFMCVCLRVSMRACFHPPIIMYHAYASNHFHKLTAASRVTTVHCMSSGGPGYSLQQGGSDELGGSRSVGRTGKGDKKQEKFHSAIDKGEGEVDETLLGHNPW